MAAISDMMMERGAPAEPARMLDGARWLARGAQRLTGVALILATLGLWVQPGALIEPETMLIKLGLSLGLGFAGLALLQGGRAQPGARVAIDTVRREVRLVRDAAGREVIARLAFAHLGRAEQRGGHVRLWASDGGLVAEVALTDATAHRSLVGALQDAGKL